MDPDRFGLSDRFLGQRLHLIHPHVLQPVHSPRPSNDPEVHFWWQLDRTRLLDLKSRWQS